MEYNNENGLKRFAFSRKDVFFMLEFKKVVTPEEIKETSELAREIWNQHFICILSQNQIDYMVDKFQSEKAITEQIEQEGYQYYNFVLDGEKIGYFAICEKPDNTLFLSKLYIKKSFRGNGYARQAFEFIKDIAHKNGNTMIWLTVNIHNNAVPIYEKLGMKRIRSEITEIGHGYVMNDHIYGFEV